MKKLLICCRHDSFIKASYPVRRVFSENGYSVEYFIVTDRGGVDPDHLLEIGFRDSFNSGSPEDILDREFLGKFDAVFLSLQGPGIFKVVSEMPGLFGADMTRPITFGGYCGIVYEKHAMGLMDRQGLDVFFVNSRHDFDIFDRILGEVGVAERKNIKITGLPLLDMSFRNPAPLPLEGEFENLLFAGQPTVPEKLSERTCVAFAMVELAEKFPNKTIYFKPRHRPNQDSVHKTQFHYQNIFKKLHKKISLPPNLIITYDPILELLEKVDFCLTISSTAAFEAVNKGVPVGFLIDFGIREDYGTTFFAGSGCCIHLSQLFNPLQIIPDENWWKRRYLSDGENSLRVFKEVDRLVEGQIKNGTSPPFIYNYKESFSRYYKSFFESNFSISYRKNFTNFIFKLYYYLKIKGIFE